MAVDKDAFTAGNATDTTVTVSHTPTGTPRGVIVFAVLDGNGAGQMTGCTYGGTSMTAVTGSPNLKTTGEDCEVACWFLGSSVPTGTQDAVISVDFALPVYVGIYTLTANGDVEVIDTDVTINADELENPSSTLSLSGRTCFAAQGFFSGQGNIGNITELTDWTADQEDALTGQVAGFYSYDTIGSSDVTMGWTQTTDDAVAIGIAVSEIASGRGDLTDSILTMSILLNGPTS